MFTALQAQEIVKGVVRDDMGDPLPGVYIESESGQSAETDPEGKYKISANKGESLTFSFIGKEEITKKVSGTTLNVTLRQSVEQIGEVIVTGIGGKRQSRALGYSATKITSDELTEIPQSNPLETLSGKIAGVDISSPAQPGASTKIIFRGLSSITGSNQPLYVIDGSIINDTSSSDTLTGTMLSTLNPSGNLTFDAGTSINDLDPNSIESVNFLKGAAATALYGSRGANGVIVIETKKGKGRLKVNVSSSVDFSEVARVPHLQTEFGQGWNGESYSNVAGEGSEASSNENGSWGARFDGKPRLWGRVVDHSQQLKPYVPLADHVRDFYETGVAYTNSVIISGSDDKSDVSLSFSQVSSDGVIPTDADKYIKSTFGVNAGLNYDRFRARVSGNFTHKSQNAVPTGSGSDSSFGKSLPQELIQIPVDISIVDMKDQNNIFNTPSYFFSPYVANPYVTLDRNKVQIAKDRLFGNINLQYDLMKNLVASFQVGTDIENERVKRFGERVDYDEGSPQELGGVNPVLGGVQEYKRTARQYDTYFNLNYYTDFANDFTLNALAGVTYNERNGDLLSVRVTNLIIPGYFELGNSPEIPEPFQQDYKDRLYGLYGQAELGYKNRYFLTLSARNDWNSTLPPANNSYFYPSAALSAIVFDTPQSFLKLRTAYARVGNGTNRYSIYSSAEQALHGAYFGTISYPFGGTTAYEISRRMENTALKPELTDEIEMGFESRFLKNRLGLDVSLYDRQTSDLIVNLPIDPSTGYTRKTGNFLDLQNRGIELTLTAKPIKTNNFQWDMTYTFSKNESKVKNVAKLTNGQKKILIYDSFGISFYAEEGKPLGVFYGPGPLVNDKGQYVVNPSTGFYEADDNEQYLGDTQRDFIMGWQNSFTYKNFKLSIGIDWKQGGKMYSYTKRLSHFVGNGLETTYNDRNPFIIPNSVVAVKDKKGKVIRYNENTNPVKYDKISSFYNASENRAIEGTHVIDKTFVRLRMLSLGYKISNALLKNTGIRDFTVSLYGRNLFLWTPDDNPYVDPETTSYGRGINSEFGEFATHPSQRSYGVSIKFSF